MNHGAGHLRNTVLGWKGDAPLNPLHILSLWGPSPLPSSPGRGSADLGTANHQTHIDVALEGETTWQR